MDPRLNPEDRRALAPRERAGQSGQRPCPPSHQAGHQGPVPGGFCENVTLRVTCTKTQVLGRLIRKFFLGSLSGSG